jgi:hypothetical protein
LVNLEWVLPKTNVRHAIEVLGVKYGPCGERNGNTKLTCEQVAKIRAMNGSNVSIAEQFHVCDATVWNIKNGKTWKESFVSWKETFV